MYKKTENADAWQAWQLMEQTDVNLFLTGKAGSGKTTFLKNLRAHSPKRMVVVAPTGVAAINAGGVTIHSFFQIAPGPFLPLPNQKLDFQMRKEKLRLIRTLELLVIDEISMVRADLLDHIDFVLRSIRRNNRPFGGVQLLLIGDLHQLSPVVKEQEWQMLKSFYTTQYFFSSKALQQSPYVTIELKKIYRQRDEDFVRLLNKIRINATDTQSIQALNERYIPNFMPADSEGYIRLTTHNSQANDFNSKKLNELKSTAMTYTCEVMGNFPENAYPAEEKLTLKVGAQVMFLKNATNHTYYNGKIGVVTDISPFSVEVTDENNEKIEVGYEEWSNTRYEINQETGDITEVVEGSFKQIPLRLAWAVTIHKSQGLTFDKVIIDAAHAFAAGQVYVALSRCRTLNGIVLGSPIPTNAIRTDNQVTTFVTNATREDLSDEKIESFKNEYFLRLVTELFDFVPLNITFQSLIKFLRENFAQTFPALLCEMNDKETVVRTDIMTIAEKFNVQMAHMPQPLRTNAELAERIVGGAKYFGERMSALLSDVEAKLTFDIDNKTEKSRFNTLLQTFVQDYELKRHLLSVVATNGFNVEQYLQKKAKFILDQEIGEPQNKATDAKAPKATLTDVLCVPLYDLLRDWRTRTANEKSAPVYIIASTRALIEVANHMPLTPQELLALNGWGEIKVKTYGTEILGIVADFIENYGYNRQKQLEKLKSIEGTQEKTSPRKKQAKELKQATHLLSLEIFKRTKSIEATAQERELTYATIFRHLSKCYSERLLPREELITNSRYQTIVEKIKDVNPFDFSSIEAQELIKAGYQYEEIRFVHNELIKG